MKYFLFSLLFASTAFAQVTQITVRNYEEMLRQPGILTDTTDVITRIVWDFTGMSADSVAKIQIGKNLDWLQIVYTINDTTILEPDTVYFERRIKRGQAMQKQNLRIRKETNHMFRLENARGKLVRVVNTDDPRSLLKNIPVRDKKRVKDLLRERKKEITRQQIKKGEQ